VCPTGVFTDRTQGHHYTRKWDLQSAPSLCVHCGLGCNTLPGERDGMLRRIRNRFHHLINAYFICDRGRYGYEFVNSDRRIRRPLLRGEAPTPPATVAVETALEQANAILLQSRKVIGIGSPRASLEANFALRALVGPQAFFAGFSEAQQQEANSIVSVLRGGTVASATLQSIGLADAVLVLGEDPSRSAPMVALNLRRLRYRKAAAAASGFQLPEWNDAAVRQLLHQQQPDLFIAATYPTQLDEEARLSVCAPPRDLARLGFAIWAALDEDAEPVSDLTADQRAWVEAAAQALLKADNPLVVTAAGSGEPAIIEAAANIAWRLKSKGRSAGLFLCAAECNSIGLALMQGRPLSEAFRAVTEEGADTVVVLENDLYRRAVPAVVDEMLHKARHVIVIDHLATPTTAEADIVLPAATFADAAGTLVNNEGRAQRYHAVISPQHTVRAGWRWLQALMPDRKSAWTSLADVVAEMAAQMPVFQPVTALGRLSEPFMSTDRVARQSHRYSGRTAVAAHISVFEPKPPEDPDSPLSFSMEGYQVPPPAPINPRYWAPGWNSVQALHKFQSEISGPLGNSDLGCRLIAPETSTAFRYFDPPEISPQPADGEFHLVPMHHVFGSEALSMACPSIAQRAPEAYLALAPDNAVAGEGERVKFTLQGIALDLPVRLTAGLPDRVAGLPVGLPGVPAWAAPSPLIVKLSKGSSL
jgi:NADH-quinone oxidoreductase subunit G